MALSSLFLFPGSLALPARWFIPLPLSRACQFSFLFPPFSFSFPPRYLNNFLSTLDILERNFSSSFASLNLLFAFPRGLALFSLRGTGGIFFEQRTLVALSFYAPGIRCCNRSKGDRCWCRRMHCRSLSSCDPSSWELRYAEDPASHLIHFVVLYLR